MPSTFRRLWLVLWRILGIAGDLHFGWSMLVQYVLPSGAAAVLLTAFLDYVSGFGDYLAESHWLFRWAVYVSVFILIFVALNHLITLGIKTYRRSQARRRPATVQPPSTTTYDIENVLIGDQRQEKRETTAKRRAVNDLLGNALEEGESLKQGRSYALESENPELEDIEIADEGQASFDEEVRTWVDRTYELIDDALGRAEAQRFISNEGYTDQELLGREPPSFLHLSSTQRKYLIPARLKRLHELIDRMHDLDINPDFDPEKWSQF